MTYNRRVAAKLNAKKIYINDNSESTQIAQREETQIHSPLIRFHMIRLPTKHKEFTPRNQCAQAIVYI